MGSTNMTRMVGTEHAHDPVATTAPWDLVSAAGTAAAGLAPKIEGLGRYVVLRAIGQGGMGVVLAAYDPTLDRKVAIKLLREGLHAGSEGAVRMQREAQAMARLSHPNVAQVYEVGEAQGRLYLVMELVEGTTLREWLAARPRARHEVLRCFMEAGRGLAAAHAAGLIHRDFKPDNAMIGADGRVRVLDFGLSRSVLAPAGDDPVIHSAASGAELTITAADTLIGTPAYMSPEQHMRREADARSDQFSFCVALFEALHGERPFPGRDLRELSRHVVTGAIVEARPHSQVPAWLRQVLVRGLQREPAARWPTMDALLAALARDPQRARRRWLAAGLAAVAVAGAGYGAAAYQVAQAHVCSGAAEELRGVWDPPRREALEQAVRATGVAYAASVLATVTTRLDAYAERWVATHDAACEANRRGHASAQLFDRRMACLRLRRTELAATVDVLLQTTADSVANLVEAVGLPPVASCEDDARLLADVPTPADPRLAAEVLRARARLARLQALERGGRFQEALAELLPELAAMQRLGDVALLAEGHLLAGKLRMHTMQGVAARVDLDLALQLGLESRLDAVAAEALAIEIFQIGIVERRAREALVLTTLAEALVRRVGSPGHLAALLHNNIGAVHQELGDDARSIAAFQRGLDLLDPREENLLRWVVIHNLTQALIAVGELERARALGEPALRRIEQLYDRCYPVVTSLRSVLAKIDAAEARFDAAIAGHEQAVECLGAAFPAHTVLVLANLAETALLAGDDDAARHYVARADAIAVAAPEARPHLATMAIARADLELRAGHHDAARRILEPERAEFAARQGPTAAGLALFHTRLGLLDHLRGADQTALTHLQRAAALLSESWHAERGLRAFTHAQVLRSLGREPAQVATLVDEATRAYRRAGPPFTPRVAEIEAWAAALPVAP